MAGAIGGIVNGKEYELKIGKSFSRKKTSAFHTLRYDFKPASIDTNKPSLVEIQKNNQTVVTVPHIQDGGSTTFKGGKRPCTKECILIIDKETGEITLEKISSTLQLKKSRSETKSAKIKADLSAKLNLPQSKSSSQSTVTKPSSSASSSQSNSKPTETITSRSETLSSKQSGLNSTNMPGIQPNNKPLNNMNNRKTIAEKVMPKKRNLSMSSQSGSGSSSSDSSDSDTEEDALSNALQKQTPPSHSASQHKFQTIQQQQCMESISQQQQQQQQQRMHQSIPAPSNSISQPVTGQHLSQNAYLGTLQNDLHLSDSDSTDSD